MAPFGEFFNHDTSDVYYGRYYNEGNLYIKNKIQLNQNKL